jgi:hypothetical protein
MSGLLLILSAGGISKGEYRWAEVPVRQRIPRASSRASWDAWRSAAREVLNQPSGFLSRRCFAIKFGTCSRDERF